ncbi:MAG: hypothetical protein OQL08_07980 [Gammaproteobacteria bacterium]|nr:hypothetical protein [Gammaproteobacteria bacterium]
MITTSVQPDTVTNNIVSITKREPQAIISFQDRVDVFPNKVAIVSSSDSQIYLIPLSFNAGTGSYILAYDNDYAKLVSKNQWVADFFSNSASLNDVSSLLPYYSHFNELIAAKDFETLDMIINRINVEQLSEVLLVGVLRLTYRFRDQLPSWKNLSGDVQNEVGRRGLDKEVILRGLL